MTFKEEVLRRIKQQFADRLGGQYGYSPGSLPRAWESLIDDTGVDLVWEALSDQGVVQIVAWPDDLSWDDLVGDMFDPEHADSIPGGMRELSAQQRRLSERIDSEGQWVHVSQVIVERDDGGTLEVSVDTIGGFVGDDFEESGYKPDLQIAALDDLAALHNLPSWRNCHPDPRQRPTVYVAMMSLAGLSIEGEFQWTQ